VFKVGRIGNLAKKLLVVAVSAAFTVSIADQISVTSRPVFQGLGYGTDYPLWVEVQNNGPQTSGELVISSEGPTNHYSIEIPAHSVKRLLAYTMLNPTATAKLQVNTGNGSAEETLKGSNLYSNSYLVIAVPDQRKAITWTSPGQMSEVIATPDLLPTKSDTFDAFRIVVLGPGAEAMSDGAAQAVRNYALKGGFVVVPGKTAVAADPRFADILRSSTPDDRKVPYGAGNFAKTADDFLTDSSISAADRGQLLETLVFPNGFTADGFHAFTTQEAQNLSYGYQGGYGGADGYGRTVNNNPFSTGLPDTSVIISTLIIFFIVVVPLNLLILKKFKKGEWAWVTAPVISLIFAGFFFKSASRLYAASMSTQSSGMILADQSGDSYFTGNTQMFFPKGGSYDLHIKNLEDIQEAGNPYYDNRVSFTQGLDVFQDAQDGIAPKAQVANLSFHQWALQETMPHAEWVEAKLHVSDGIIDGTITNLSKYTLKGCLIHSGQGRASIESDLPPGKTITIRKAISESSDGSPITTLSIDRTVFSAQVEGFDPGPSLGKSLTTDSTLLVETIGKAHVITPVVRAAGTVGAG
jgi:hypothetical protein